MKAHLKLAILLFSASFFSFSSSAMDAVVVQVSAQTAPETTPGETKKHTRSRNQQRIKYEHRVLNLDCSKSEKPEECKARQDKVKERQDKRKKPNP